MYVRNSFLRSILLVSAVRSVRDSNIRSMLLVSAVRDSTKLKKNHKGLVGVEYSIVQYTSTVYQTWWGGLILQQNVPIQMELFGGGGGGTQFLFTSFQETNEETSGINQFLFALQPVRNEGKGFFCNTRIGCFGHLGIICCTSTLLLHLPNPFRFSTIFTQSFQIQYNIYQILSDSVQYLPNPFRFSTLFVTHISTKY